MTLIVHTARVSTRDRDRLDVTRGTGRPGVGLTFAPSWTILRPAKRMMARDPVEAWDWYAPRYRAEMLVSYAIDRAAWEALLARPRVVLCCYCADAARCHRTLLAGYLGKLGADVRGELYYQTALPRAGRHPLVAPGIGEDDGTCDPDDDAMHGLRAWGDL